MLLPNRLQRFEDALASIMGCTVTPPAVEGTLVQVLIRPTFHPPSCMVINDQGTTVEASFVILQAAVDDVWRAIWDKDEERLFQPEFLAKRPHYSDIVELTAAQQQMIRQQIADTNILSLADVDLAARDGIVIRCTWIKDEHQHVIRMTSPTQDGAPDHYVLIQTLFDLASDVFREDEAQAYLRQVRGYLHP